MKRLLKVNTRWNPNLAYAIGLITTDGNLSSDGRHLEFTSKDKDLVILFKECLGIANLISRKYRASDHTVEYSRIQFGDKNFYEFLLSIGLTPVKSRILGPLNINADYFADFLRGCIDGDGCIFVTKHPEGVHPQLRLSLFSASHKFLEWINKKIHNRLDVNGGTIRGGARIFILSYGKADAIKILKFLYYKPGIPCLLRKYVLARPFIEL